MLVFFQIIEVILGKRQVQDLDFNTGSLVSVTLATMAVTLWFGATESYWGIVQPTSENPFKLLIAILSPLVFLGLLYKYLELKKMKERFMQTSIAFLGASAVTGAAIVATMNYPKLMLFGLGFFVLSVVISIKILRQALDISVGRAFATLVVLSLAADLIVIVILSVIVVITGPTPS